MSEDVKIQDVDLFLTEECNLDCKYCFHKKGSSSLSTENASKILDKLAVLCPEKMNLNFWGGEPLLNVDVLLDVIKDASTLWHKDNLTFHLVTNGTIYSNEVFKVLQTNRVGIQVSLDGSPDCNDIDRSKGELVSENIKKMLVNFPNLSVRMTYTPRNVHKLVQNILYIKNLGVKTVMHQAVIEDDWNDEAVKTFAEQTETLFRIKVKNPQLGVMFVDKNNSICDDMQPIDTNFCEAGKKLIAVLPNGDVYPCHRAASGKVFKLGSLLSENSRIIRGMFLNINKSSSGCTNCKAWKTCHTCIITHHQVNGKLDKVVQNYCKLMFVEATLAYKYVPIIKMEDMQRKISAIANVIYDVSLQIKEIHTGLAKLKGDEKEVVANEDKS